MFEREDDFAEIAAFVAQADEAHGLSVTRVPGPMAQGLSSFLATTHATAIVLGTRRGDPNAGGQDTFCPSSPGWPAFMRVNPILSWGYGDVWSFLDAVAAPYCPLYDRGYTSIGAEPSTRPNSALLRPDGSYAPARALTDGRAERAGRASAAAASATPRAPPGATPRGLLTRAAAVVLVGDELLSGRVADANGAYVCRALRSAGWAAARVSILPDDIPAIAAEIEACLDAVGVVLVCGGVGPTPDDVTMAAVAAAFRVPLARDADLETRLRSYFGGAATSAHLKMADAPACGVEAIEVGGAPPVAACSAVDGGAEADAPRSPFPLLACPHPAGRGTVYVLPGVPHLLRRKWPALVRHLSRGAPPLAPFRSIALALSLNDEALAAPAVEAAVAASGGAVAAGSYPVAPRSDGASVVVVLESKDGGALTVAVAAAKAALPPGALVGDEADPDGLGRPGSGTSREGRDLK